MDQLLRMLCPFLQPAVRLPMQAPSPNANAVFICHCMRTRPERLPCQSYTTGTRPSKSRDRAPPYRPGQVAKCICAIQRVNLSRYGTRPCRTVTTRRCTTVLRTRAHDPPPNANVCSRSPAYRPRCLAQDGVLECSIGGTPRGWYVCIYGYICGYDGVGRGIEGEGRRRGRVTSDGFAIDGTGRSVLQSTFERGHARGAVC